MTFKCFQIMLEKFFTRMDGSTVELPLIYFRSGFIDKNIAKKLVFTKTI